MWYTFEMRPNNVLKRESAETPAAAVVAQEAGTGPQRLFASFWYQAGSRPATHHAIAKCEANLQGTDRRAVITNRPGATVLPDAACACGPR